MCNTYRCEGNKCILQKVYGGNASLACDSECSLSVDGEYHKRLPYYQKKYPEHFKIEDDETNKETIQR